MVGSRAKGDVCVRGQTSADLHGDAQDEDLEEQHHLPQAKPRGVQHQHEVNPKLRNGKVPVILLRDNLIEQIF
jgi:hypothetical protein